LIKQLEIYPNPLTKKINIQGIGLSVSVDYSIYTIDGKRVLEERNWLSESDILTLDLGNIDNGVYYLRLIINEEVMTYKFLKF